MKVIWTPEARQDRLTIWDYIKAENQDAAVRIDKLFSEAVARLTDFPMLGHPGTVANTRELTPYRSYRLIYEVDAEAIWILAIVHTARQWPPIG